MIELTDVSKSYDHAKSNAVDNISLKIERGEFLVLVGESGCGKTTTLKMINRLIEPTSGRIEIDGEDIRSRDPVELRRGIGYVFQEIGLFPHMDIAKNIGTVPDLMKWPKEKISSRVNELLELIGLEPSQFARLKPHQLSGGQRQRIGVARALAAGSRIMLMDEPFGALDPITRGELLDQFIKIQKKLQLTVVMVTHDMMEALVAGDRIAVMKDGRIIESGTPAELLNNAREAYTVSLLKIPKEQTERLREIGRGENRQ